MSRGRNSGLRGYVAKEDPEPEAVPAYSQGWIQRHPSFSSERQSQLRRSISSHAAGPAAITSAHVALEMGREMRGEIAGTRRSDQRTFCNVWEEGHGGGKMRLYEIARYEPPALGFDDFVRSPSPRLARGLRLSGQPTELTRSRVK